MKPLADKRLRLLIVDDDSVTRMMANEALTRAGVEVVQAGNGAEAMARFVEIDPDIVMRDVEMPVLGGFETCWRIRQIPEYRNTPILMLTANDDTASIEEAQRVMQALQQACYQFEGSINKLSVDDKGVSLLAAFGLPPLSHEDDPDRGRPGNPVPVRRRQQPHACARCQCRGH